MLPLELEKRSLEIHVSRIISGNSHYSGKRKFYHSSLDKNRCHFRFEMVVGPLKSQI